MEKSQPKKIGWFSVTFDEIISLFRPIRDPEGNAKVVLFLVGILLTPITLAGVMIGYVKAYNRHMKPNGEHPTLAPLKPIARISMILWGVAIWIILLIVFNIMLRFWMYVLGDRGVYSQTIIIFMVANTALTLLVFYMFNRWKTKQSYLLAENRRYGSAHFANPEDMQDLIGKKGYYIGGDVYGYDKQGHLITCGGTRGGKGINIIMPNLLDKNGYEGSWVVIDPKGENCAVTSRWQKEKGNDVLILDPWNLQANEDEAATFNPLDLLVGGSPEHLADDASVLAEMIVPEVEKGDRFFNDRARSLIAGLIIHIALSAKEKSLYTLWKMLRLDQDGWDDLLATMKVSGNEIVKSAANEILSIMETSERTYGSIMASAHQYTDFLKSPALQKSLAQSNININKLTDGKTTLYVIIPADKLKSHYQWLRLVITTSLRICVRNRNKRVTFLLDEFIALGYLPEIEVALSTYAGYNVTLWIIIQSLIQLKNTYGESWETFLGNALVKHFFSVRDNFTADYVSKYIGNTTFVTEEDNKPKVSNRPLVTPDEVRRGSANEIFTFIESRPAIPLQKKIYTEMPQLNGRYDPNPYFVD